MYSIIREQKEYVIEMFSVSVEHKDFAKSL